MLVLLCAVIQAANRQRSPLSLSRRGLMLVLLCAVIQAANRQRSPLSLSRRCSASLPAAIRRRFIRALRRRGFRADPSGLRRAP
jgi:hypothetical protein